MKYFKKIVGERLYLSPMNVEDAETYVKWLSDREVTDTLGNTLAQTASLWYRDSSWKSITEKEQEIAEYITRGGRLIGYDQGAVWLKRASPWAQRMNDPSDEMIRRIVLNIAVEFLD